MLHQGVVQGSTPSSVGGRALLGPDTGSMPMGPLFLVLSINAVSVFDPDTLKRLAYLLSPPARFTDQTVYGGKSISLLSIDGV